MGAKGSAEAAAKLNADNWGHLEVCSTNKAENKFCQSIDHKRPLQTYNMGVHR